MKLPSLKSRVNFFVHIFYIIVYIYVLVEKETLEAKMRHILALQKEVTEKSAVLSEMEVGKGFFVNLTYSFYR